MRMLAKLYILACYGGLSLLGSACTSKISMQTKIAPVIALNQQDIHTALSDKTSLLIKAGANDQIIKVQNNTITILADTLSIDATISIHILTQLENKIPESFELISDPLQIKITSSDGVLLTGTQIVKTYSVSLLIPPGADVSTISPVQLTPDASGTYIVQILPASDYSIVKEGDDVFVIIQTRKPDAIFALLSTNKTIASVDDEDDSGTGTGTGTASGSGTGTGAGSGTGTGTGTGSQCSNPNLGPIATDLKTATGSYHTCSIITGGAVRCWGRNTSGQLGYDDTVERGSSAGSMAALADVFLGAGRIAKSLAAGSFHTCALLDNNTVKCWGDNSYGQLGRNNTTGVGSSAGSMSALTSINLGAGRTAKAIAAGGDATCAILDNSTVKCWGRGFYGQLGSNATANIGHTAGSMAALNPVNLGSGHTAKAIAMGSSHTCAILDDDSLKCWGYNFYGQLGLDDNTSRGGSAGSMDALENVKLGTCVPVKAVNLGSNHTCAILGDDTLKCWGYNARGQLGYDDTTNRGNTAGAMAALTSVNLGATRTAKSITTSSAASCAILDDDTVKCWGQGDALGLDTLLDHGRTAGSMAALTPVNLGAGRHAIGLSFGSAASHMCANLDDGTLKCWGAGEYGQLGYDNIKSRGNSTIAMASLPTVDVGATRTPKAIVSGTSHSCALLDDNTVKCWGYNSSGQLGYDDTTQRGIAIGSMAALTAVNLGAGRTAKVISAGASHSCAILDNDTLKCWGQNTYGQLGQDHTTNIGHTTGSMASLNPIDLGSGRTAKAVSAYANHTCAILDDDTLKCWGQGSDGKLGLDSTSNRGHTAGSMAALSTVNLGAGRTAKSLASGPSAQHTCVILDNDTLKCWGNGISGKLGYDASTNYGGNAGDMAALTAVNLGAGRTAVAVAVGGTHTCTVLDNADLKCWGDNTYGQLGYDDTDARGIYPAIPTSMANLGPVLLGAGRTAKAVATGNYQTCATLDNDTMKCWGIVSGGYDFAGRFGGKAGSMSAIGTIILGAGRSVASLAGFPSISVGGSGAVCAVLDDLNLKCWGSNSGGQLGLESIEPNLGHSDFFMASSPNAVLLP